ncbi:MAG: hypothetical protein JNM56_02380 [Planctomycetia bacterium]|nr:hypothetical protein [Planctomycetia bacterium]
MPAALRLAVLLPALCLLPVFAAAQLADKSGTDEAQLRAKLLAGAYVEGKITEVRSGGADGVKHITVAYQHQIKRKVDPFAARKAEILKKIYDKVVESKFEPAIQKVGAELSKAQEEASDTILVPIPFVVRVDADVKLRTLEVPLGDDGKPKKLSVEEQKKLKGDPRLPGFAAAVENFEEGQLTRFFLDRTRFRSAPKAKAAGDGNPTVYPITMLVIVPPPMNSTPGENPFFKK